MRQEYTLLCQRLIITERMNWSLAQKLHCKSNSNCTVFLEKTYSISLNHSAQLLNVVGTQVRILSLTEYFWKKIQVTPRSGSFCVFGLFSTVCLSPLDQKSHPLKCLLLHHSWCNPNTHCFCSQAFTCTDWAVFVSEGAITAPGQ